ncbi:F0F1 ATP synthase subunit B [Alicyclobacillus pomorum]|uniref:F0F1 ATP synthase subunit B n=1 Tax=Alicyclobacillus pomorum TaxID=204470 RepID=UPI001FE2159E|nr:F0F1 ATP synthase subunit B [Alicyclobacillus pomorum]
MGIIEPGTMIVSLLAFLIVFFIIYRVTYKPLSNMMEQRRQHIEHQILSAEQGRAEAEKILAEQRKLLDEARRDAKEIMDTARARAEKQAQDIIDAAQAEAQRILDEGRQLIERERAEAMNGVMQQVAALTVELTTKLLRNHVSEPVHEEMLKEAQKNLGELVS